jgi:hypothetical protein
MAATFTGTITRKARGTGSYVIARPNGTAVISVLEDGKLKFFAGAGNVVSPAIPNATDAATAISQQNLLLAYLRTLGLITP